MFTDGVFSCKCLPQLILLQQLKVSGRHLGKTVNITLSCSIKETYEVIEDAISEALMSDHSVAIKHFVRRIWEVLSTRLIQLA